MRFFRALTAVLTLPFLSGCGYIHFGRLPKHASGDPKIEEAYSNLATEHKILKQELVLARKEGDTLRAALDRGAQGSPDVVARLNETTRELAALRASYAQLQAQRTGSSEAGAMDPTTQVKLTELEDRLAASMRNYTQLQEENARLRSELSAARTENSTLAERLTTSVARNEETQAALAQLNTELLAQKEARARAEQASSALRAQLSAVMATRSGPAESAASPATAMGSTSASSLSALQLPKAPPADAPPTAELRVSPERLRATAATMQATEPEPMAAAAPTAEPARPRIHIVEQGDTLEKIARKYYGSAERWSRIYAANNDLLRDGRPLKPGMELEIPE